MRGDPRTRKQSLADAQSIQLSIVFVPDFRCLRLTLTQVVVNLADVAGCTR